MLGSRFGRDSSGSWTKPTNYADVDKDKIHGLIYVLASGNQFIPYEYRTEASAVDKREMHRAFLNEFTKYLTENELEGLPAPEVLDNSADSQKRILEFVLGREGTVMLEEQDGNHGGVYIITGWTFEQNSDGVIFAKGGQRHAKTVRGTHQVFMDGKPLPTVEAV